MQIEQFSDILEWTANYHKALAEQLHCCCKKTDLNKLVLDYLAMHENHLSKLILAFKNLGKTGELDTYFVEYINDKPDIPLLCPPNLDDCTTYEQVIEHVMKRHQQIIELFSYLRKQMVVGHQIELLDSILETEQQEIKIMAHGINRAHEL
ncbi:hypothetical protein C7Y69_16000 [Alteromonas sp. KS69]|jgi:hypothetical protein|uniref:hypothetical protein n=1 Tax=Alteromonas TaxID=226 RepID=UPI0005C419C1|nr:MULTISPECIES: hypothetical protein [Alteromonas]MAF71806.1 hypothetical protein [Alteromonas sp.]MAK34577.1 hypothetical protein [Flavobacteriaceae bacterium]MCH2057937.1 hypothetical protein [Thalassotalea sp.]AJP44031.1 hypothetical protein EP12_10495 [Alteromonas australica]QPL51840.1 hypothetical protein IUA53_09695 [Alteromonas sp. B31-7]|tara:strand:- start:1703 stop:2155 length:453 start_codon:yes stop_codon:yes gene_type:complete